jgi:two-component system, OmpR family, phosphate regulon sensor histidine kinase PhoR
MFPAAPIRTFAIFTPMKSNGIRLLIIFGIITLVGIIFFQVYWVKKTYDIRESQFNQTITVALFDVAVKIAEFNQSVLQTRAPVHQVSSNYFIVEVNDMIDKDILELFLKREFIKRNLVLDFEYAIYDCHENEMVFGRYVSMGDPADTLSTGHIFEMCRDCTYYFGINFPGKRNYIISNMNVWFISSIILISAVVFFGWSLWLVFRQKRLSEIQRDFINNMTHEFKTPISTIAISAEVLARDDAGRIPGRVRSYATIIAEQNNRLKEHVEKVLQVANIEKKRVKPDLMPVDLPELIRTIADSFRALTAGRNGTVEVVNGDGIGLVLADRFHLTNILVNLLDNAQKYCSGSPHIRVVTSRDKRGVAIAIADNGIGIEKKFQKRVFSRFFRVPTGSVHNVKGFGLGLHYVQSMVKSHGWSITLESEKGKGSTFSIYIPARFVKEKP